MGGFGGGMGVTALLRIEQVQKEIELVADQQAKLRELAEGAGGGMREEWGALRDLPEDQRAAKMEELRKKAVEREAEMAKKVEAILLPHQMKRLKEIRIQLQGVAALNDAEVVKALGLTEAQQAEITKIRTEAREQGRPARPEGEQTQEERRAQMQKMMEQMRTRQQEVEKKLLDVLTADQKAKLEEMKGKKFELDMGAMRGGRGERPARGEGRGERPARGAGN
jgi:hypothetical protein